MRWNSIKSKRMNFLGRKENFKNNLIMLRIYIFLLILLDQLIIFYQIEIQFFSFL